MNTQEKNLYIDPDIPMEQQIVFLRQSYINLQFKVFETLKEKFGSEGVELFKTMWRQTVTKGIAKIKDKSFEEIKKFAGRQDKIFGFNIEKDYVKPDEFQYTITYCPYLEESKRRDMNFDLCDIIEEVEMEEVSKHLAEMTEPVRMCHGDSKCTIRLSNTLRK